MATTDTLTWRLTSADAGTIITREQIRVNTVIWDNPTNAAHRVELRDINDNIVFSADAKAADATDWYGLPDTPSGRDWNGLKVETLGSGTVQLFLQ